ncbi:extracellular solute-binding protein [Phytoactinopolyspora mesophila]|uniref:Extracellular solute-binding protein n=1 Tax=Phytoactinopolyspora mesophila TaxID=2650750 RepID=A0A7K3M058_9ACTN|nr:extracellular solute-binding protein [Phytoactinopolyspora mesophila]NDL56676.1 extracellular solute-binding protein [Phytoactinopolyspora mesophila]
MSRTTRKLARFAAAATAVALVAACAPGSDDDGDDAEDNGASAEVETDLEDLGDVTLVVWDQEVRGGQSEQIDELNQAFEEEYPNITVDRVSRSTDDLRTTLRLALTDDDAPDVVQANNSRTEMGQYVGSGLLEPLDAYADTYGWFERFPESVRSLAMYSDDGEVYGDGALYGLPQMGEIVGLYYSKPKLDELGIDPPTTYDEFVAALETADDAGELPIQFGNLNPFAGIHEYGFVQNQFLDAETIRNLGFGRPGSSWLEPESIEATETIMSWVDDGYFTDGFAGLDYDDSWQQFTQGEGIFLVAGTWLLADLDDAMGEDVGFVLPPAGASGQRLVTGGISIPFAIPANSANKEAAAAYIDFITNADAMTTVAEAGNLPVVDADQQEASGLQAEVFEAWGQAGAEDLLVPYLDYATPTFFDTITAAIQDLLGGQRDPEDFLNHLETEYLEQVGG